MTRTQKNLLAAVWLVPFMAFPTDEIGGDVPGFGRTRNSLFSPAFVAFTWQSAEPSDLFVDASRAAERAYSYERDYPVRSAARSLASRSPETMNILWRYWFLWIAGAVALTVYLRTRKGGKIPALVVLNSKTLYRLSRAGEETGPYQASQLLTMWDHGMITADSFCWAEGWAKWRLVSEEIESLTIQTTTGGGTTAKPDASEKTTPKALEPLVLGGRLFQKMTSCALFKTEKLRKLVECGAKQVTKPLEWVNSLLSAIAVLRKAHPRLSAITEPRCFVQMVSALLFLTFALPPTQSHYAVIRCFVTGAALLFFSRESEIIQEAKNTQQNEGCLAVATSWLAFYTSFLLLMYFLLTLFSWPLFAISDGSPGTVFSPIVWHVGDTLAGASLILWRLALFFMNKKMGTPLPPAASADAVGKAKR